MVNPNANAAPDASADAANSDETPAKKGRFTEPLNYSYIVTNGPVVPCVPAPGVDANLVRLPHRGSDGAAGADLHSIEKVVVPAGGHLLVRTGLTIQLLPGTYGRIAPRSGLAFRHQIHVGAGVVDADFRDEVQVLLFNRGKEPFNVEIGDRIAQLIVQEIETKDRSNATEPVQICRLRADVKNPQVVKSGIVVYAAEDGVVPAKGMHPFPTGIRIGIPHGYYGHASPLTELAFNHKLGIYAGVIDEDYTGEVKVLLANNGTDDYVVKAGDAIMQILVEKYTAPKYVFVNELIKTKRGCNGYVSNDATGTIEPPQPQPPRAITFTRAEETSGVPLPVYDTEEAAGADVYSTRDVVIQPGESALIDTGILIFTSQGYYARVAPRTNMAIKHGIDIGGGVEWTTEVSELQVLLYNFGTVPVPIRKGQRVAQIIGEQIAIPNMVYVDELAETQRGEAGFGSTGVAAVPHSEPVDPQGGAAEPESPHSSPCKDA